jgi:hypothetical protein
MPSDLSADEIARTHRWHAIECNNVAWALSELPARTAGQNEDMLHAAHAAAFHWSKVGSDLQRARAAMLLAHVHAALERGTTALPYARASFDYLVEHDPPDWELAFAHAILAHAAHAAGDVDLHRRHFATAKELGSAIANPQDKAIFLKTFERLPEP